MPGFDVDEAPTRPVGAGDAPFAAPSASPRSAEPVLAEAVALAPLQEATAGEPPPSSAFPSVQPDGLLAGASFEYAPDPFAPSSGAAPAPLTDATSPDPAGADRSAEPLGAPNQSARPRSAPRRARWVIVAAVLVAIAVSTALLIRSSTRQASGSAKAARESGRAASEARKASSDSRRSGAKSGVTVQPGSAAPSSQTEPAPAAAVPQPASNGPQGLDREIVLQRVRSVLATAERCHMGGRATGTATVVLTFEGKGHVSDARIDGEPIASAPVAGCILTYARSIIIPKFSGSPFTISQPITLR